MKDEEKINNLPEAVIELMLFRQEEQGNHRDLNVFKNLISSSKCIGGFNWDETKEGKDFWAQILNFNNIDLFYKTYPDADKFMQLTSDIREEMLANQVKQGNPKDIAPFMKSVRSIKLIRGFDWDKTTQGFDYWEKIIELVDKGEPINFQETTSDSLKISFYVTDTESSITKEKSNKSGITFNLNDEEETPKFQVIKVNNLNYK
jgi:hypothetical protein